MVILVGVSVLWIPVILNFKNPQLFIYIQAIQANLAPPMTAVFVMAFLWHRMTEPGATKVFSLAAETIFISNDLGAFFGLLFGFIVGVIRFFLEFGSGTDQ